MPNERFEFELATVARAVEGEACDAEPPVARPGHRKAVALLTANAGPEIAVHELDDRPPRNQRTIEVEHVHVVREAEVGRPASHAGECRLDSLRGDAELRKSSRRR